MNAREALGIAQDRWREDRSDPSYRYRVEDRERALVVLRAAVEVVEAADGTEDDSTPRALIAALDRYYAAESDEPITGAEVECERVATLAAEVKRERDEARAERDRYRAALAEVWSRIPANGTKAGIEDGVIATTAQALEECQQSPAAGKENAMTALKPCPFCGADCARVGEVVLGLQRYRFVYCDPLTIGCGVQGPRSPYNAFLFGSSSALAESRAIEVWNTRVAIPDERAAMTPKQRRDLAEIITLALFRFDSSGGATSVNWASMRIPWTREAASREIARHLAAAQTPRERRSK